MKHILRNYKSTFCFNNAAYLIRLYYNLISCLLIIKLFPISPVNTALMDFLDNALVWSV